MISRSVLISHQFVPASQCQLYIFTYFTPCSHSQCVEQEFLELDIKSSCHDCIFCSDDFELFILKTTVLLLFCLFLTNNNNNKERKQLKGTKTYTVQGSSECLHEPNKCFFFNGLCYFVELFVTSSKRFEI